MRIASDILATIGNTPLVRLRRASQETGCTVLGKAEFLNPGLSVKDRAALSIVLDAERRGLMRPGGTIVEGTAGNTGIGLAMVAALRGYRTVIVIPETQSAEKKQALRNAGARLVEVPGVPYSNPDNYVHAARRLAERLAATEPAGAFFADQFDNLANRRAHEEGTGPEILAATQGGIDGFVCAVGTGGTLAGVAKALRERKSPASPSPWPIPTAPRCRPIIRPAPSKPRVRRSRRGLARAGSQRTSRGSPPISPSASPMPKPWHRPSP